MGAARVRRRGVRATAFVGAASVALAGGVVALTAPASGATVVDYTGAIPAGTTLSGVLEVPTAIGGVRQGVLNFGTWRNKPVQVVTAFTGGMTWAGITGITSQGQTKYWDGTGFHVSWSMPLIPADGSDTLENAAAGKDNAYYTTVAQQLVAGGESTATLRLGWEAGGAWFTWGGYTDPAAYVGAFRQAVTAMRAVPGAHFTFDWNYALASIDPTTLYPGDAYVDYIGADIYDRSYAWQYPATDHVSVWNALLTEKWGMNWLASFATTHAKRITIPEWGVTQRCDKSGGGDDPSFIQNMQAWIASHDVAYETYSNGDNSSCELLALENGGVTTAAFPTAAASYISLFGSTAPPTPSPTPSSTASLSPSISASPTVSVSPSVSASPSASVSPTVSASPTVSVSPSVSASPSISPKPTVTPSPTVSASPSTSPTPTVTASPSVTASPTSSAVPIDHTRLKLSTSSLRLSPVALDGSKLTSKAVYIWVSPPTGTVQVKYYIDAAMTLLLTSTKSPWDLGGTSIFGTAQPVYPATAGAGVHTITAVMTDSKGVATTTNATFTVTP
jgi:hypothetical protein